LPDGVISLSELINNDPLEVSELQNVAYLGEVAIFRFEDIYDRK